uniref:Metalloendopeptidase n=1 Tax=Denticeps clupeoides TaxID=299321 RepID=A0AAY4AP95_9TELE
MIVCCGAQTDRDAVHQIWPDYNGKVSIPFVIMPQLSKQYNDIMAALNMIRDSTCVTFHPRTNEADYINFQTGYGCASLVGFTGGVQPLYVGPSCTAGNICHELMHTLGFFHEHSRQDRENYINILYGNIIQGKESNFLLERGDSLGLPYDLSSILHYGSNFFSSNGQPTILPKSPGVSIGQRSHLSALDVAKVKRLYKCGESLKSFCGLRCSSVAEILKETLISRPCP